MHFSRHHGNHHPHLGFEMSTVSLIRGILAMEYGRLATFTHSPQIYKLPHRKVASIQTCPKYKLAPLFVYGKYSSCIVRLSCILSSIECVPGSAGNGLGQQNGVIDQCYVYSVMSIMPSSYIDLLLLNAIQGL